MSLVTLFFLCLNFRGFLILSTVSRHTSCWRAVMTKAMFSSIQTTLQCTGYSQARRQSRMKTPEQPRLAGTSKTPEAVLPHVCFSPALTPSTTAQNTSSRLKGRMPALICEMRQARGACSFYLPRTAACYEMLARSFTGLQRHRADVDFPVDIIKHCSTQRKEELD